MIAAPTGNSAKPLPADQTLLVRLTDTAPAVGADKVEVHRRASTRPDFEALHRQFILWLGLRKSPKTVETYNTALAIFRDFARLDGLNHPDDVTVQDVESFLLWYAAKGAQASSINGRLFALRTWWKWMRRVGATTNHAPGDCEKVPQTRKTPKYLPIGEAEKLLKGLAQRKGLSARRDEAIIATALFTGVRCNELVNLRMSDVDVRNNIIHIHGKGNKERELAIVPRLHRILHYYIKHTRPKLMHSRPLTKEQAAAHAAVLRCCGNVAAAARELGKSDGLVRWQNKCALQKINDTSIAGESDWLFVSLSPRVRPTEAATTKRTLGAQLGRHGLNWKFARVCHEILGRHVHPHMLRHSCATRMRERGADLQFIQETLGHADISTTTMYAHLAIGKRRKLMQRYLR